MTHFDIMLFAAAVCAGMIASISGFGVGSVLTPLLGLHAGTRLAVAAVTIPHVVASGLRYWQLRRHVNWNVVKSFGLTSAAGGLVGALFHNWLQSNVLTLIFAGLLIFTGIAGVTGLAERMRFMGPVAWIAGGLSGLFGGLVGNQGGIRSAALLGFEVRRDEFVGTATAVALLVDGARLPAYICSDGHDMLSLWPIILSMTAGVTIGTLIGKPLLSRIPESTFRKVVCALILILGLWMGYRALQ